MTWPRDLVVCVQVGTDALRLKDVMRQTETHMGSAVLTAEKLKVGRGGEGGRGQRGGHMQMLATWQACTDVPGSTLVMMRVCGGACGAGAVMCL